MFWIAMNRENCIYDGKSKNLQKAIDIYTHRGCILCAVCGSELIIIAHEDRKLIKKHQLKPGIYCPVSPKHIYARFRAIASKSTIE
jgi:uncharacterized Zn finger protein (UPF0148 family)